MAIGGETGEGTSIAGGKRGCNPLGAALHLLSVKSLMVNYLNGLDHRM